MQMGFFRRAAASGVNRIAEMGTGADENRRQEPGNGHGSSGALAPGGWMRVKQGLPVRL